MEKRKYSQWKFIATFVVVMGAFAGVKYAFGIEVTPSPTIPVGRENVRVNEEEVAMDDEVRSERLEVMVDDIENTEGDILFEEITDSVDSIPSNSDNSVELSDIKIDEKIKEMLKEE